MTILDSAFATSIQSQTKSVSQKPGRRDFFGSPLESLRIPEMRRQALGSEVLFGLKADEVREPRDPGAESALRPNTSSTVFA